MAQYLHYNSNKSQELNIIFPGSSLGFQTGLINKIFNAFVTQGKSAITYNYPFLDRGEENSSGEQLTEELKALNEVLKVIDIYKYSRVNFIGKSLGAIVASYFLRKPENHELLDKSSLSVLGYVKGSIDLTSLTCKTLIVQGENDKFGNIAEVQDDFKDVDSSHITFVEIPNADHSYRDSEKNPVFEDKAIEHLMDFVRVI